MKYEPFTGSGGEFFTQAMGGVDKRHLAPVGRDGDGDSPPEWFGNGAHFWRRGGWEKGVGDEKYDAVEDPCQGEADSEPAVCHVKLLLTRRLDYADQSGA